MAPYCLQGAPKYLSFLLGIVTFKVASLVTSSKNKL